MGGVFRRVILLLSVLTTVASLFFLYQSAAGLFTAASDVSTRPPDPVTSTTQPVPGSTTPASATGSLAPSDSTGVVPAAEDAIGTDVLRRINRERSATGAGVLRSDQVLTEYATAWAEQMALRGYQHSGTDRLREILASAGLASVSENIHAPEPQCPLTSSCTEPAFQPTSGVLHVDWMYSASHRTTALQPAWSRAGVGVHCDGRGRLWAVVLFGSAPGTARDPGFEAPPTELREPGNDGFLCSGGSRETNPDWRHTPVS